MKTTLRLIIVAIATVLLSSCGVTRTVSIENDMNSQWQGKSHADIVSTYGAPDREASDGRGGSILIYEQSRTTTDTDVYGHPGWFYGGPNITTTTHNYKDYTHFYINAQGFCYQVKTNLTRTEGNDGTDTALRTIGGIALGAAVVGIIASIFGHGGDCYIEYGPDPYWY